MFAVKVNKIEKFLFFHLLKNQKKNTRNNVTEKENLKILYENSKLGT